MPVYQAGSFNPTALQAPDLYVIIQPPSIAYINGVATDGLGLVGVGSWGAVNVPMMGIGNSAQAQQLVGPVTVRSHDIATAVAIGDMNNVQNYILVRVTDGTDTAASAALKDTAGSPVTGMTLTGFYTGLVGNGITASIVAGTAANTYRLSVQRSGFTPEVFDNISQGVAGGAVTAGTGYSSVPALVISAPQAANGVQATGTISLKVLSATPTTPGTGYVTGDTLTLPNGVLLTATANAGAITALAVTNAGSLTDGSIPTNPVAPSVTSGAGTGAAVTMVYGLGAFVVTNSGSGYTSATATLSGGGAGTPGTLALTTSVWLNMVNAVNNGQSGLRGPSVNVIATLGTSANAPNLTATYTLSGGTDGTAGVTDLTLEGADGLTRSGMYALRKSGAQVGNLIDCQTSSTWSAQLALGLQEGIYFHSANPPGTSVTTSAANLASAGVDGYGFACLVGDWTYWQDTVNGVNRMVSPATFSSAKQAATSPEQSILNADDPPLAGILATQRSMQNDAYSDPEIALASTSRLEVITQGAPAGAIFACRTGRNASSNSATNGDNYTRMTNYIAFTIASAFGYVPGKVQTINLRRNVKGAMDAFFANLQTNNMIGNVNAPTQPGWSVQINAANNPFSQVALGYMVATVMVTYLSIVRYFLVNIEGGQTVTVTPQ